MAYVEVEVDLEDFSSVDLVEELIKRKKRNLLTKKQLDNFDYLFDGKIIETPLGLVDQMKLEVILPNYQNIPYEKICQFFEKGA